MSKIVGISFRPAGPVMYFDTGHFVLHKGDKVIVRTENGAALGEVSVGPRPFETTDTDTDALPKVFRLANAEDLAQHEKNQEQERAAYAFCLERIKHRGMQMKLVMTEVLFDSSKIIFFYTADGRVDFRELVKDLVGRFRTRIEMRQIGVRNEAKMIGGIGCCGRELCCATFLKSFDPVSVKMAKEQNLSLNPAKISGGCGRLMCCLTYEYETYIRQRKGMPKLGKRVNTVHGPGRVIRQNVMMRTSTVQLADGSEVELAPDEILPRENG